MTMAALRFILYRVLTQLARLFIDRQVAKHADAIFGLIDQALPSAIATGSPDVVDITITRAIATALGGAHVAHEQVAQVRDLFDPVRYAARRPR
jgi:hypothetical protein